MNRLYRYGYGLVLGKLSVIEKEAETVKKIFSDYISGKSLNDIVKSLMDNKVEYYMGKCFWCRSSVNRILSDERYIGGNGYPPIIAEEIYLKASEIKNSKKKHKTEKNEVIEHIKNIFFCDVCGKKMNRVFFTQNLYRWYCKSNCKRKRAITDERLLKGIVLAAEGADILRPIETYKATTVKLDTEETVRYKREIERLSAEEKPNFNLIKKLVFEYSALKFGMLKEDRVSVYGSKVNESLSLLKSDRILTKEFLINAVERIFAKKDGCVSVKLITGDIIEESENGARSQENSDENSGESAIVQTE